MKEYEKLKLTYDEWKDEGFAVVRGEKSRERNEDGKAVFSFEQVTETDDLEYEGWSWYDYFV